MRYNIAIDGPAGAGKSTIAKRLAKELGAIYVDTGAMYRAMAYYFIQKGVDKDDIDTITKLCKDVEVSISYENGEQQVILNGENITGFIRQEAVGNMASATSVYPVVREKLVELQRQLAARENVVMDGRDIGTVVLPDANVKIFLTASSKVRAKRRFDELTAKGEKCDIDAIEKEGNVLPAEHQTGREPFILLVDAYRVLPKSRPKKVLCEEDTFKPDWDNIGKLVSDALNGLAWKDDSQVVKADISKWPRMRGLENDRMVITVIPLGLMNMDEVAEVNPCRS